MFKEVDLSRALPRNTVAVTFRYQITSRGGEGGPLAELADNPEGKEPVLLSGESGRVMLRLLRPQKVYYSLPDRLHLNLWIVEYRTLTRRSC